MTTTELPLRLEGGMLIGAQAVNGKGAAFNGIGAASGQPLEPAYRSA